MTNTARIGIVLPFLSLGLAGCQDTHSFSVPSAPTSTSRPGTQPTGQPTVTAITPNTGSTRGEAWGIITGTQFQPGATVRLGSGAVASASVRPDGTTIFFTTSASAAGRVDVTVTNPNGLSSSLAGAYTFAPPETFDVNGDWMAYQGDGPPVMRFTIRDNMLVRVSCEGTVFTFPTESPVHNGEFSVVGDDGAAVSGRLVSPVNAIGTGPCNGFTWYADKSGVGQ